MWVGVSSWVVVRISREWEKLLILNIFMVLRYCLNEVGNLCSELRKCSVGLGECCGLCISVRKVSMVSNFGMIES